MIVRGGVRGQQRLQHSPGSLLQTHQETADAAQEGESDDLVMII